MAVFKPFCAVRPDRAFASETLCPPYDVVTRQEAAEISAACPESFMHVIRADGDLQQESSYSHRIYTYASDYLQKLLADKVLIQEKSEAYYIYSQTMNGRTQTGIVGCASIDDYENGTILRHEVTREEKEQDRIRHFDTCSAHTEPVFLIFRQRRELASLMERIMDRSAPEYDTLTSDGVRHRLWVVTGKEETELVEKQFAAMKELYIADGHHRTASAVKVGKKRRESFPDYTGSEPFNFFMAAAFPDNELQVLDYNRLIRDLNGFSREEFLAELSRAASVRSLEDGDPEPDRKHSFAVYLDHTWYLASFHPELYSDEDPVRSLDVSLLQEHVLGPVLGIKDPRTDSRIDFSGGIRGAKDLENRVDSGEMAVAFRMYPVCVEDIIRVADAGMIMPPKSTWFEPKLGSGWFIHMI